MPNDRNYFNEGQNQFDYSYDTPYDQNNPMNNVLMMGSNSDVLQDVVEDIRLNSEAYGKNQVEGSLYSDAPLMGSNVPDLIGPGNAQDISAERGMEFVSYQPRGVNDLSFGGMISGPSPTVAVPYNPAVAQSRPFEHSDAMPLANIQSQTPGPDISSQPQASAVQPNSQDLNNSANRLGFIIGNQ